MKKNLLFFTFIFNSLLVFLPAAAFQKAGIELQIPSSWTATPPASAMRAGEWKISSKSKEIEAGEFVIFYFGVGQGGDAQSNINRWKSQVTNPQGAPAASEISTQKVGTLQLTQIRSSGTYTGMSALAGVPPVTKNNYGFIGVVVEGGPEGSLFLRATGPEGLIQSQIPLIQKMLQTLKIKK